jgi:hypothetical protein
MVCNYVKFLTGIEGRYQNPGIIHKKRNSSREKNRVLLPVGNGTIFFDTPEKGDLYSLSKSRETPRSPTPSQIPDIVPACPPLLLTF